MRSLSRESQLTQKECRKDPFDRTAGKADGPVDDPAQVRLEQDGAHANLVRRAEQSEPALSVVVKVEARARICKLHGPEESGPHARDAARGLTLLSLAWHP